LLVTWGGTNKEQRQWGAKGGRRRGSEASEENPVKRSTIEKRGQYCSADDKKGGNGDSPKVEGEKEQICSFAVQEETSSISSPVSPHLTARFQGEGRLPSVLKGKKIGNRLKEFHATERERAKVRNKRRGACFSVREKRKDSFLVPAKGRSNRSAYGRKEEFLLGKESSALSQEPSIIRKGSGRSHIGEKAISIS